MTRNDFEQLAAIAIFSAPGVDKQSAWRQAAQLADAAPRYIQQSWYKPKTEISNEP